MKFEINKVIDQMIKDKQMFVSERHLQVYFILAAKKLYPSYDFIPEYVFYNGKNTCHIDLIISDGYEKIAIEFKYVVAGGVISVAGDDNYKLKNQSAIDVRRHQCVADISRLESYSKICNRGYFLLITNMKGFWIGSKPNTADEEFHINDNSELKAGLHRVKANTSLAKDCANVELKNSYKINYNDYLNVDGKDGVFKYLTVEVLM